MPGRDGTGPRGIGPITGRGMGCCGRLAQCERRGLGYGPYGADPAGDKDRLAAMEKILAGQLEEVRRRRARLEDDEQA